MNENEPERGLASGAPNEKHGQNDLELSTTAERKPREDQGTAAESLLEAPVEHTSESCYIVEGTHDAARLERLWVSLLPLKYSHLC